MVWITLKQTNKMFVHINRRLVHQRLYSGRKGIILGIETSCDDTGCAIVDTEGNILGESLNSQHLIHLNNGGIIPPIAKDLHRKHIENVVDEAVALANLSFDDIDAIATTVKPGKLIIEFASNKLEGGFGDNTPIVLFDEDVPNQCTSLGVANLVELQWIIRY
ncbi:unnamed protein product [Phaedon cochleariae]|uniref:Gcp-like domain-containing protein n=1 Tax=Phaedon cochleariae TaxID=80249 RepID=A0A9N9X0D2_PHACE|nr:unnamed protein product [Phaedon cochleariae]